MNPTRNSVHPQMPTSHLEQTPAAPAAPLSGPELQPCLREQLRAQFHAPPNPGQWQTLQKGQAPGPMGTHSQHITFAASLALAVQAV